MKKLHRAEARAHFLRFWGGLWGKKIDQATASKAECMLGSVLGWILVPFWKPFGVPNRSKIDAKTGCKTGCEFGMDFGD